jgi:hypothetical protein
MSDTRDEAMRQRCRDHLISCSSYSKAMIEELSGYMVEEIKDQADRVIEEVCAFLDGAEARIDKQLKDGVESIGPLYTAGILAACKQTSACLRSGEWREIAKQQDHGQPMGDK